MSEPLSNLPPEQMTARATIEPCYGQCNRQPSLTPDDLIALRDEMRVRATYPGNDGWTPNYRILTWADRLDTLITHLSGANSTEQTMISGAAKNESEAVNEQRPTAGD
jgi:hypothetical protein